MPLRPHDAQDPYRNYLFKVEIDGIMQGGFSEVTGFDSTTDAIEYRAGDQVTTPGKGPGLTKYGDIVLKWGLTDSRELWNWRQDVIDGKIERRNVSILVLDDEGNPKITWVCERAWPSKLDPVDFNAKGNDRAIMTLTLVHEGITQQ